MINFDSLTLKLFEEENKSFFIGGKIQKIQQPSRNELIFYIRNNGESRKFYINFNPDFYHICFMSEKNETRRYISIPKAAPMFCMLLRKYIQNSKIVDIVVPKYERIFEIYFSYYNELNEKSNLCLAIELMGKYSNVILYNYDTNVIIGCAHNVSSEKSRERELCGLLPYVYPKKQRKKNILKTDYVDFESIVVKDNIPQSVSKNFYYLTTSIVEDFINEINPFSLECLYEKLVHFLSSSSYSPCISEDYSKFFIFNKEKSINCSSINDLIDEYFSFYQLIRIRENLKSKTIKFLVSKLSKLYLLKQNQEMQAEKLEKAIIYKTKADLIMSNLYFIKQNLKSIELNDFEGNSINIELDENLTPTENANKYYFLYKKAKSAYEHAKIMLEETNSQILYLEEQKYYAENSEDITELQDLINEFEDNKSEKENSNQKIDVENYEGYRIYIGKNKKQNDYILSKIASGEDIWFHPLNAPGAHVLVKIENKENIPDKVILKAAQITKEYSAQKNNSKTSIIYTKRKYVKKANNKLAFVTYKNETEIII